jgi:transcriptional regulator with GAF, ATPase, and Fis domain
MDDAKIHGDIPAQIINVWQDIVNSASALLSVPSVMINRLEPPDLEVFRSNEGSGNPFPSGTRMPMMGVYCAAAAARRRKIVVEDARKDPEWADSPTAKAGIYAYLGFPLCWPDGNVFGTICAVDVKENKWGSLYEDLLRAFRDAIQAHLALVETASLLERRNKELEESAKEVKTLSGILPICASCKRIRDDQGYWNQVESYIKRHSLAQFSHSLCPDCVKRLYPDFAKERYGKGGPDRPDA